MVYSRFCEELGLQSLEDTKVSVNRPAGVGLVLLVDKNLRNCWVVRLFLPYSWGKEYVRKLESRKISISLPWGKGNLTAATIPAHGGREGFTFLLFWDCYDLEYCNSQTWATVSWRSLPRNQREDRQKWYPMEKTCITKSKNMYEDIDTLQKGLFGNKSFHFQTKIKVNRWNEVRFIHCWDLN